MDLVEGDLTKCLLCCNIVKTPKSLTCYHTFCALCLEQFYKNLELKNERIRCPVCKCEEKCVKASNLKDNTFISMIAKLSINNFEKKQKFNICLVHEKQLLNILCKDCNLLVCCNCYFLSHNRHESILLSDNVEFKTIIQNKLDNIAKFIQVLSDELENCENMKHNLSDHRDKLIKEIVATKDDLITTVNESTAELLHSLDNSISMNTSCVDRHLEDINRRKLECELLKEQLLCAIKDNDYVFLLNMPDIKNDFESLTQFNDLYFHKNDWIKQEKNLLGSISEKNFLEEKTCVNKDILVFHLIYNIKYIPSTNTILYDTISNDVGIIASSNNFTDDRNYFEIEIINTGLKGTITIGVVFKHYTYDNQPGWLHDSWGYHADDGRVFSFGKELKVHETCKAGDRMGCGILKNPRGYIIFFSKNGYKFVGFQLKANLEELYPAIGMHSPGEQVVFLESKPWQDQPPNLSDSF